MGWPRECFSFIKEDQKISQKTLTLLTSLLLHQIHSRRWGYWCYVFSSIKNRLFAVSVLHWGAKGRRYRLKSGSATFMVSGEAKDVIVAEASAHFNLRKQIIVFQDGTEVPYTRNKGIKYPYKAKASEKLYLLHVSERRGIYSNIYKHNFLEDLQYFDDKMDEFAFPIVNFRHISTCTT